MQTKLREKEREWKARIKSEQKERKKYKEMTCNLHHKYKQINNSFKQIYLHTYFIPYL